MHRPGYIDFRGDPLMLSKIDFAKNVIFEDRAEWDPQVYWELRHFANAFTTLQSKKYGGEYSTNSFQPRTVLVVQVGQDNSFNSETTKSRPSKPLVLSSLNSLPRLFYLLFAVFFSFCS